MHYIQFLILLNFISHGGVPTGSATSLGADHSIAFVDEGSVVPPVGGSISPAADNPTTRNELFLAFIEFFSDFPRTLTLIQHNDLCPPIRFPNKRVNEWLTGISN